MKRTCPNTGLRCVPNCSLFGEECAGLYIPLNEWPSDDDEITISRKLLVLIEAALGRALSAEIAPVVLEVQQILRDTE